MQHRRRTIQLALCSSLALVAVSSTVRAETIRGARFIDSSDDYGYVFSDDVMQAGAFTPDDPRIVVTTRATRVTLIRPRTAFVAELLKSVENL
jgi:hypothetical protein